MDRNSKRNIYTYKDDFQKAVNRFFGRTVIIEERVVRSVCIWRGQSRNNAKHPRPLHIWSVLEKEIPSIYQLYECLGVGEPRENEMGFPNADNRIITPDLYDSRSFNWIETLESIFDNPSSDFFSSYGTKIKESGQFGIDELVKALLEYNGDQVRRSDSPFIRVKGFILSQLAYRNPELSSEPYWRLSFSEKAIEKWSSIFNLDQSVGNQQFIVWYDGVSYKVSPFIVFGGFNVAESAQNKDQIWHARGNVLEPLSIAIEEQATELESLINSRSPEKPFQIFFEKYPNFLSSIGPYQNVHSQLILHKDDGTKLIPDFFLERLDSRFCDLCDLKLPTKDLVRNQRNRLRFRDAVMEGIAQLEHYRDWFENEKHRDSFFSSYGISAFRPKAVLIIGRRGSFSTEIQRLQLESGLPNWFQLLTYDDVLSRVRQWKNSKFY